MRANLVMLLSASLFACRTSDLGTCSKESDCSPGAVCDLAARVCVATDAPSFSNIAVSTPAAFTDTNGRAFFDTTGGPLSVSASVTGRAGVDPASVCLTVSGETGACAHPGTAGAGSTFTFSLPRPSGTFDGTTPLDFTISASSPTARQSTSAVQHVYFDNQPPAIAVASDSTPYARTLPDGGAAPITVSATISDGAGIASAQLISGTTQVQPASSAGSEYTFQLNPAAAPPDTEGAYAFQVRAVDGLGHESTVGATRTIDDAPPAVAVQIYKDVPDGGGVTYPAAVANTGWTGATFVYTDTVHVSGTVTDLSGVGSATLRVDGIELNGGVATGTSRPLGCAPGTTSCPFSLDVTLNDAGVPFHSGASTFNAGTAVGLIPAADLRFTIDAQDTAAAFEGTQSPKPSSTTTTARATRMLWVTTLSGTAVSGLAVHPSGDLIVTLDGGTESVYDFAPDRPLARWSFGSSTTVPLTGVNGTPAIGAGDATTARIYVGGSDGGLYSIHPNGTEAWESPTSANSFVVGPAVAQVTIASTTVDQIVVPDGIASPNSKLWRATSATDVTSVTTNNRDFHAAPLILNGAVFFATQTGGGGTSRLTKHTIGTNGALGTVSVDSDNPGFPYFGIITDGTNLYAATRPASGGGLLLKIDTSFTRPAFWSDTLAAGLAGEPTIGIDGMLYGGDLAATPALQQFNPTTGAAATFVTPLGTVGMTPLQGSDGHLYVARRPGALSAYEGNQLSWSFDPPGAILRYATMDCEGRLFTASGATVYAFITDDRGLADTPWPSMRRDARNTGNAGAPRYGIRTAPNACDQ
jgi:hypothetical protein